MMQLALQLHFSYTLNTKQNVWKEPETEIH